MITDKRILIVDDEPDLRDILEIYLEELGYGFDSEAELNDAFRRFKDVLVEHPRERERWFGFKDQRLEKRVLEWLESEDIEPILAEPPAEPEN